MSIRAFETGQSVLEFELMAEEAQALGDAGRAVESALKMLGDAKGASAPPEEIDKFLDIAANAVWNLFVQREVCGMRNGQDVIELYSIPDKVLARLGSSSNGR
jgi:hypothetical protein